jgi:hypothetical protein
MASKNPFGNLHVRRDEDDEEVRETKIGVTTSTPQVLFTQNNTVQKKKKVRPDEKKKQEEHQHYEEDTEEGFSVVNKNAKPYKPRTHQTETVPAEKTKEHHLKNKGAFNERNSKVVPGKRLFDRQSGTGRGRDIKKDGMGGKHTWTGSDNRRPRDEEWNQDEDCKFIIFY